jgi:hypothetical protein
MPPDLREALESAIEENSTPDPVPVVEPVADLSAASDPAPEPVAAEETPAPEKLETEPVQAKPETASEEAEPQVPAKPSRVDRAPASWKGTAKGEWGAMSLAARQEVHRREMQVEKVLQETAPVRQFAEQFSKTVSPYMARINEFAQGNAVAAVDQLLKADYTLSSAPKQQRAAFMAKLIRDYDVDIGELDSALAGTQQQTQQQSPDIAALVQQQLQAALAPILQREAQTRQQQEQRVEQTVEQMAVDPKYPHFEEVREDMAYLIGLAAQKNVYMSLDQAYIKAVRLNDDIYAQTVKQTTMQSANQQHAQAQRAKAAASSVSGSPAGGGNSQFVGNGDLRSSIEAAFGGARL